MAAEAIVSAALEKLTSTALDELLKWVRWVINVRGAVDKLKSNFEVIKAVLEDAEWQQVQKEKASVRDWLYKLKEVSYDMDDALDEWNTAILKSEPKPKVCSFVPSPSYCFNRGKLFFKTAQKIQDLNERLDVIANQRQMFGFKVSSSVKPEREETTSFINVATVKGRDEDKERMVKMLLNEGRAEEIGSELQMIAIVGMGGIGKTTLAKLAFNDKEVDSCFEKKIWLCVSDTFNEMRIAKDILRSVMGDAYRDDNMGNLEHVLQRLKDSIGGKKFLLVLDDVWTERYGQWDQLKLVLSYGSHESKILVTTRKESVARSMGCSILFTLGQLSEEESWSLFSQIAFSVEFNDDHRNLEEIGREIAKKCKGLPLALRTLGGLMRFKNSIIEWRSVLESEVWELKEAEEGLFLPLMFSYFDLPSNLRQCFSCCAIFPKDYVIEKKRLIKLWMAQGFLVGTQHQDMEMVGENNFNALSNRFFFQDFEEDENGGIIKCKMHDMVHDFALFLTRGECLTMESSSSIQAFNGRPRHLFIKAIGWDFASCTELLNLFDKLQCLRTLIWSNCGINESTKQIGKLIHLRHLDLSENAQLEELPEAVCELYNLLVLDISGCRSLKRLPRRMGNLVNLLHLWNEKTDKLNFMPKGMEKLTSLKTLNKFVVTHEGAALSDLWNLNHLCGTLEIEGLGLVRDEGEAKKAQLQDKKALTSLSLQFDPNDLPESQAYESSSLVLEALKPPSDLKELNLYGDERGPLVSVWPNWIMSLSQLKELRIRHLVNAEQLASLGKLPSVESLTFDSMERVKKVGVEFLGIETSFSPSSSSVVAFPNLKSLQFENMKGWEEWDYGSRGEEDITIMPRLSSLSIKYCEKLKMFPNYILQNTTLQELKITRASGSLISNLLKEDSRSHTSTIPNLDTEEEKEIVGHPNPIVRAGPSWIPSLTQLKNLEIFGGSVEQLPPLGKLSSLESLCLRQMGRVKKVGVEFLGIETSLSPSSSSVVAFPNLKSLHFEGMYGWEEWDYGSRGEEDITIMPRLSSLKIECCWKLKMLPPLGKLPFLESLDLSLMSEVKKVGVEFLGIATSLSPSSSSGVAFRNLKSLRFSSMQEWEEWEEWDYGSRGEEDITIMPCLSSLTIGSCPKLKMLPNYILKNTTLQKLRISGASAIISNLVKEDNRSHTSSSPDLDTEEEKEIVGHPNPIVWAGLSWGNCLTNLKNLAISDIPVKQLPPLGKLPSLESLNLSSMEKVKKVGVEFLGIETSVSPSSSSVVAFRNLKSLRFWEMFQWEEWDYGSRGEEDITIMPRLSSLKIWKCPKLKMLPNYILQNTTLQQLEIYSCPIISKRCKEDYQSFIGRLRRSDVRDK